MRGGDGNRTRVQGFAGPPPAPLASGPQALQYRHFSHLRPCRLNSMVSHLVRNADWRAAAWRLVQCVAVCCSLFGRWLATW
jgi:hypothetical protein